MSSLLNLTKEYAEQYLDGLQHRSVFPSQDAVTQLTGFHEPLPETPIAPEETIRRLHELGSPATVASAGPRYFGFVTGGAQPVTLASSWMTSAWDQNAHMVAGSPVAAAIEQVAAQWLVKGLGLPTGTATGFVTGATMANFSALAAARHRLLRNKGWDVESQGLFGAPPIQVVVSEEVHISVLKALSLLGFGSNRVIRVATDNQGRMQANLLPKLDDSTLICLQAGNVNTGAFDPVEEICFHAKTAGAWVHVDGAFGLWARFCPELGNLSTGLELADSWAADAHKWLNVPYDSGLVFCRDKQALQAAMRAPAPYLVFSDLRDPCEFTPELSRRGRGIDTWAALKTMGHSGVAELVQRCCDYAQLFAILLEQAGFTILNDVVLNQVLVVNKDASTTERWIEHVQQEGTCWCGKTQWQGHTAMRISVSSWATTEDDVRRSVEAMLRTG